ncbi:hypothetical protein M422DRAFT_190760 [Sphaerobolus stellatus SS14]|uniref:DDE Tnp4 domain-containing protein n=1 Tax=Sphaerobolus stellatus (strain SS14) TaxID=990650 RepID=A0A0C9U0Y2_SPHS4|nr:hypothetical protein M422DRAFT_190760 [Sphaerobolus stellatus SS14]
MWADSAYPVQSWCIAPFKRPAADLPENRIFNYWLSRIRIRSEHVMGFLKGRFQSLKGLRQQIKDQQDHCLAVEWIRTCLIIHTLIHDIEQSTNGRDPDFEEELIELGLEGTEEAEDAEEGGAPAEEDEAHMTPGQKALNKLKRSLFASGIIGRPS